VAESGRTVRCGSVVTAVCITLCGNEAAVSTIGLNLNLYDVVIAKITVGEGLGGSVLTVGAMLEVHCRGLTGCGCLEILSCCDLNEIVTAGYYEIGVLNNVGTSLIAEELSANVTGPILNVSVSAAGGKYCCVIGRSMRSELTIGEGLGTLLTAGTRIVVNCKRGTCCRRNEIFVCGILLIEGVLMVDSGDKYACLILDLNSTLCIREVLVTC
jgi:hypothetical protein